MITFGKSDLSKDIAYIVENDLVIDSLTKEADLLGERLKVLYNNRVEGYRLPEAGQEPVKITLGDGSEISTSLMVSPTQTD